MNQATAENLFTSEESCPFFALSPQEGKPSCATTLGPLCSCATAKRKTTTAARFFSGACCATAVPSFAAPSISCTSR